MFRAIVFFGLITAAVAKNWKASMRAEPEKWSQEL
jgi:hypothetical protein